jgi:hypothetical protein
MYVAGVRVREEDVLDLARLLHDAGFDDTAEALVVALEAEQGIVGLCMQDREAILRTLDDPRWPCATARGAADGARVAGARGIGVAARAT